MPTLYARPLISSRIPPNIDCDRAMGTANRLTVSTGLFLQQLLDLGLYGFQRCTLWRVRIPGEIASDFFKSIVVARQFYIHIDQYKTGTVLVIIDFQSPVQANPRAFVFTD